MYTFCGDFTSLDVEFLYTDLPVDKTFKIIKQLEPKEIQRTLCLILMFFL